MSRNNLTRRGEGVCSRERSSIGKGPELKEGVACLKSAEAPSYGWSTRWETSAWGLVRHEVERWVGARSCRALDGTKQSGTPFGGQK